MKRMNKTEKNLKTVWALLDEASGNVYEAMHQLNSMTGTDELIDRHSNRIDVSAIDGLKDDIEKLLEEKGIPLYRDEA